MDIKNMDRREFIRLLEAGALTLGSLGIASGALAQQRIFKVAYWMGPRHSLARNVFEPLVKNLNTANLGFNAKIFPAGQVGGGGPPQAYQRMVNGISHVELHLPGYTASQFPRTLVMEIPLQHENNVVATKAINGIFDKHLKQEYKGVKVLGLFGIDVPVVMTKKPVRTPDDLKGMKLRTPSRNQADIIKLALYPGNQFVVNARQQGENLTGGFRVHDSPVPGERATHQGPCQCVNTSDEPALDAVEGVPAQ